MKAVVLDGYTLNPGDLSWDILQSICELTVYDRTPPLKIVANIADNEIVLTNKTPITKEVLDLCPNIRYIGVLATGYNIVDIEYAKKKNIPVTNVPYYSSMSVAQLTFALLLEACHHVGEHSKDVLNGGWTKSQDFSYWNYSLTELSGKVIGLIGYGSIGSKVANIAKGFGMKVLVFTRTVNKEQDEFIQFVTLDYLLKNSNVISLHVPLTNDTKSLINKDSISKMKDGVIIINTARGPIISEEDITDALNSGKVKYLATDVASMEPISVSNPLLKAKNVIITPHIAWATYEARVRLMNGVVENVKGFLSNKLTNVVNL